MRAHPRSRGENQRRAEEQLALAGSSPLTRGKLACTTYRARCIGLIPAHAGKTRNALRIEDPRRAHPRSRGENDPAYRWVDADGGSSPLTRGKRCEGGLERRGAGLIPAHAGKTSASPEPSRSSRAHPRSRGENSSLSMTEKTLNGSSPLTRGKPCPSARATPKARLIPAHAGKTLYPPTMGRSRGSSPLTRGKPVPRTRATLRDRLIPAHAGKTLRAT